MSYSLTLRPKSHAPLCKEALRNKLLAAGLKARSVAPSSDVLCDELADFEIVTDADAPPGLSVVVSIPYRREFYDVTLELLNLERISAAINAELLDGNEILVHHGKEGLAALFALHARYERAADGTGLLPAQ